MIERIELSFIDIPDEKERRNQIKKLASDMVCDYLKLTRKRKPNQARSKQVQQLLQETRKMLDNDD